MTGAEKKQFLIQYEEIHESLMRFCIVKSRGIMDAKDLANDVLLVGLENYHKLENKKALLSYLFTTASRICINKARQKKFKGDYDDRQMENIQDTSQSFESNVDISLLYVALDQLPALQKEAVILFEISDLPITEIMIIQNSGSSAVKQRIKRGREKLANLLREKDRKTIAVLASLFISTNSFSMSQLDSYFSAVKDLPLPLTGNEAGAVISSFKMAGTASHVAASKFGNVVLKKVIIGTVVTGSVIGTTLIRNSQTDPQPTETTLFVTGELEPGENRSGTNYVQDSKTIAYTAVVNSTEAISGDQNTAQETEELVIFVDTLSQIENFASPLLSVVIPPKKKLKTVATKHNVPILEGDVFPMSGVDKVLIENLGDNVEIRTWEKNEIKIIPNHHIEAKTAQDEALILENLNFKVEKRGGTLALRRNMCNSKRHSIQFGKKGFKTIQFANKLKVKYRVIELNYVIMVPADANLSLVGNYKTVVIPDMKGDLYASLFQTDFTCGSISGKTELKLKYSKASMADFKDLKLTLFETKMNFNSADFVTISARYSDLTANRIKGSDLYLFESNLTATNFENDLKGTLKHAHLNISNSLINAGDINAFESHINIPKMNKLDLVLRYSTLKMDVLNKLNIPLSFESDITLNKVGELYGESSKYSTYKIQEVTSTVVINSFEDDFTILKSGLSSMTFNGKYCDYKITLSKPANYSLDFDTNYGKLDYNDLNLTIVDYETMNSRKIIKGYFAAGNGSEANLKFDCFESNIKLN